MTVLVACSPQIAPAAVHPQVRFIDVLGHNLGNCDAGAGPLAGLGAELLNPTIYRGRVDADPPLGQQVANITVRERIAAVPPYCFNGWHTALAGKGGEIAPVPGRRGCARNSSMASS